MRFTRKGSGIDYEKAEREVLLAIEQGSTTLTPPIFTPEMRNAWEES